MGDILPGTYEQGQAELAKRLHMQYHLGKADRVILFISDGMGLGTQYATRLWEGQSKGLFGEEHETVLDSAMHVGLSKTYTYNAQTPDSASTATAFMSGHKTINDVVNTLPSLPLGACDGSIDLNEHAIKETIADKAKALGYRTGLVSTARLTHATPSAAYAVSAQRNWEASLEDSWRNRPNLAECKQKDIATQLVDAMETGRIDLAMGGGWRAFVPSANLTDTSCRFGGRTPCNPHRRDNVDLVARMRASGVRVISSREEFDAFYAAPDQHATVFAGFPADNQGDHMSYEVDRDPTAAPSLAEMTRAAIKMMSQHERFFLQIEGGRVDHALHSAEVKRTVTENVAFEQAVAEALRLSDLDSTLIIATADHSHGLTFSGYCGRGSPINGMCHGINQSASPPGGNRHAPEYLEDRDGLPYTVAAFATGPSGSSFYQNLTRHRQLNASLIEHEGIDFLTPSVFRTIPEMHSGEDVIVWAWGAQSHLFTGTFEQHYIFHAMHQAMKAAAPNPFSSASCAVGAAAAIAGTFGALVGIMIGVVVMLLRRPMAARPLLREIHLADDPSRKALEHRRTSGASQPA